MFVHFHTFSYIFIYLPLSFKPYKISKVIQGIPSLSTSKPPGLQASRPPGLQASSYKPE